MEENTDKRKFDLNRIGVWVAIISIITGLAIGVKYLSQIAVKMNDIGVIDERLDKKIVIINENHDRQDENEKQDIRDHYEAIIDNKNLEIEMYKMEVERLKEK